MVVKAFASHFLQCSLQIVFKSAKTATASHPATATTTTTNMRASLWLPVALQAKHNSSRSGVVRRPAMANETSAPRFASGPDKKKNECFAELVADLIVPISRTGPCGFALTDENRRVSQSHPTLGVC